MSQETDIARAESIRMRHYEREVTLQQDILRSFTDLSNGGPIAYILARAAHESAEATQALTMVDATNAKAIMQLQSEVMRHRDLVRWLNDAIQSGEEAWRLLNNREHEDILDEIIDSSGEFDT